MGRDVFSPWSSVTTGVPNSRFHFLVDGKDASRNKIPRAFVFVCLFGLSQYHTSLIVEKHNLSKRDATIFDWLHKCVFIGWCRGGSRIYENEKRNPCVPFFGIESHLDNSYKTDCECTLRILHD